MVCRGNPPAVAASHGVLGVAGGGDDILVDRQNHLGVGDGPSPGLGGAETSDSASDYDPSLRQTQRASLRLS
jgi:hypothetical protein